MSHGFADGLPRIVVVSPGMEFGHILCHKWRIVYASPTFVPCSLSCKYPWWLYIWLRARYMVGTCIPKGGNVQRNQLRFQGSPFMLEVDYNCV